MKRTEFLGGAGIVLLTAATLLLAAKVPISAGPSLASPYALPPSAEDRMVLLPDGRTFEVRGDLGRAYLEGRGQRLALTLPRVRRFESVTVMPTGQVLIWGGIDESGRVLESGDWFEPDTGTFTTTGRLGLPARAGHTLTVLTDGKLLMTGGWTSLGQPSGDAVLWAPDSHQVTDLPKVKDSPRFEANAELASDGSVLIEGGINDQGLRVSTSWWFDPETQSQSTSRGKITASDAQVGMPSIDVKAAPLIGPLALRFAQPIDIASLNKKTISLLGPEGIVRTRVVGTKGGSLAFIQLPDELFPSSRYTVFVQGLRTAKGDLVPYTALGFTTRQAIDGVVVAGRGSRPDAGNKYAVTGQPPLTVMAGSTNTPCARQDAFHLCREHSYIENGAWFPGQNNVADATGGHWRLYGPRQVVPETHALEKTLGDNVTALIGQVRQIDEAAVANVEVSLGNQRTRTNAQGIFVLKDIPPGRQELFIDGRTASHGNVEYGRFLVGADVKDRAVSRMPFVMYLPRIIDRDKITLPSPTDRETVLTHPDMPGLELHIPPGAVFKDREGHVLSHIALVPTPVDHAPFPLPDNFPTYFTIQPGDAVVQGLTPEAAKGIRVVYPNYGKATSATTTDFWVYSVKQGWQMYGAGHVTPDAQQLAPDAGTSLVWALGAGASTNDTNPPNGRACDGSAVANPVDARTGLFFHEWDDFSIKDVISLNLTRAYKSGDTASHEFGIGSSSNFGIHLYSADGFTTPQLVMPCGEGIAFHLVSGTAEWPLTGTVWQHTGTKSSFYGATLQFLLDSTVDGAHWILNTKDGTQYAFTRHAPNSLAWIQDRFGNRLQMTYQGGLLDQVISPSGRSLTFTSDAANRVQQVIDNTGRSVSYSYDNSGALNKVTYPDQTDEEYTYDLNHRMLTMQDRRSNVWVKNEYDTIGRVVAQTLADQSSWLFAYETNSSGGSVTVITDPNGQRREIVFDAVSHYETSDTHAFGTPLAQTTTYVRSPSGLLNESTDSLGRVTSYSYDSMGNVISLTRLQGTPNSASYNLTYTADYNQLASVSDPLGHKFTMDYDEGSLSRITNPLGYSTVIGHNGAGQVTSVLDSLSHLTNFTYRDFDLEAITDALGRKTRYVVDTLGRSVAVKDADGNVTLRTYDSNDRLIESVDGLNHSTKIVFDGNGNPTKVTTADGGQLEYSYDVRNRLVLRTDALRATESWTYDRLGKPSSYIDRKGQSTLFSYDALDRQTMISFADGSGIQTSYDSASRVIELLDTASGAIDWTYDGLDRVLMQGTPGGVVSYSYDSAGRRTGMTPAAQNQVTYDYDDADRLTALTQGAETVRINYDELGRRRDLLMPNGIDVSYLYDEVSRLLSMTYKRVDGSVLGDIAYSYNQSGQRVTQTGSFSSQELPSATAHDSLVDGGNRKKQFNGLPIDYDANGNIVDDGVNTYVWNARNQLVDVKQGGIEFLHYGYDSLGRRISKTEKGLKTTEYLYDGDNVVQESLDGVVNPILIGPERDERFARNDVTGRTYFLTDALNSTIALTDESAQVRQRYRYDPYGRVSASDTTTGFTNPYQYTGRETDAPDIYFYRSRYYSPVMGAFFSEDPAGFASGQENFYSYVASNPMNYTDPMGLMKLPADPSGLPNSWTPDPTHRDPNGTRLRDPSGNTLDFHKGRPGKPGWRGKDHWHYDGCDDHLSPGDEVPDAVPIPEIQPDQPPEMRSIPTLAPAAQMVTVGGIIVIVVIVLLSPVGI